MQTDMHKSSYSVVEFCYSFGVSRARFYELLAAGEAPPTYLVGRRRYIRAEAAREWQQKLEKEEENRKADLIQ